MKMQKTVFAILGMLCPQVMIAGDGCSVPMRCDARDFAVEKKRKFMRNVVVLTFDSVNTLISNDLVNTPE